MADFLRIEQCLDIKIPTPLEPHRLTLGGSLVECHIKRDDLIHPLVSGNKWRKLKFLISGYLDSGKMKLVSMGGAWSQHLLALGFISHLLNFPLKLFVRGKEWQEKSTAILKMLRDWNVELEYMSREDFRESRKLEFRNMIDEDEFLIYEGGRSMAALPGIYQLREEIEDQIQGDFDLCVSAGTGALASGLLGGRGHCLIFPALGDPGIKEWLDKVCRNNSIASDAYTLFDPLPHRFGKITAEMRKRAMVFEGETGIEADLIYDVRMLLSLDEQFRNNQLSNTEKLVIYCSGRQWTSA